MGTNDFKPVLNQMTQGLRKLTLFFRLRFLLIGILLASEAAADTLEVEFRYRPATRVKRVALTGTFNDWNPAVDWLKLRGDHWRITKRLSEGFYYYKLVVDGQPISDPENPLIAPDGSSVLKVGDPKPKRRTRSELFPRDRVPRPILESDTALVQLYYAAWETAWNKIARGTPENGLVEQYMNEGLDGLIHQWDACFMTAFGVYAPDLFPAMASLDNFYRKQRRDGHIQRAYWEKNGLPAGEPTTEEPMINPPIFAWLEWRYYRLSGDTSRLQSVLPVLAKYFQWIERNCASPHVPGMYYNSPAGSGMENLPRPGGEQGGWIDLSAQQVLAARCIARMAHVVGDAETAEDFEQQANRMAAAINEHAWNPQTLFYHDVTREDSLSPVKQVGAFWTLLAQIPDPLQTAMLLLHLNEPKEFNRPHRVPSLSADDPAYDPRGRYWRGSVWSPTNYMVIKGLEACDQYGLANEIAQNHLWNMARVFHEFVPDKNRVADEDRYADEYRTIWECYSPEVAEPATRGDGTFFGRQDWAGASGLGPIALLIENILGIELIGAENRIVWRITRTDRHGIQKLKFGKQTVSLICEPQENAISLDVRCQQPLTLHVVWNGRTYPLEIKTVGSNTILLRQ